MKCNCINNDKTGVLTAPEIKHVQGNVLKLAIPLTLREITVENGEVEYTDSDFVPSNEHPVIVLFSKGAININISAEMHDGNVAYIEEYGKIPVGVYAITVMCYDEQGNPYRFKQNMVLQVVDTTIEAGITTPIEYETQVWYLNAALYIALKGEDGVGIEDIITESSGDIGGFNYVTILLTDGTSRTFSIMNGSGSVDDVLNINSPSPISNRAVTTKFNALDSQIADLFGDVDYNSTNKTIRFWDKGKTRILASIDARPFIKDGMVSNVYISNNTLVIVFNTDAGREPIGISLSSIFNPNNYYNRTQINNLFSQYYTKQEIDNSKAGLINGRVPFIENTPVVLASLNGDNTVLAPYREGDYFAVLSTEKIYQVVNGFADEVGEIDDKLIYCDKSDNTLYRWNNSEFVQVGGNSGSGGITATYSNGTITITSGGSSQPTYSNGTITF